MRWCPLVLFFACSSISTQQVTVGSSVVEYALTGSGPTTVIFESGAGDSLDVWSKVWPDVSQRARVFAYSRAGYGGSTKATTARDATDIVGELHDTLTALSLSGPYVLVGQGLGGLYAEGFVRTYPEQTIGWVSVEGRPDDYTAACATAGVTCDPSTSYSAPASDEWSNRQTSEQEVAALPQVSGSLPIRVLFGTGNRSESASTLMILEQLLERNATESVNGKFITVPNADSSIETEQPGSVTTQIEDVL